MVRSRLFSPGWCAVLLLAGEGVRLGAQPQPARQSPADSPALRALREAVAAAPSDAQLRYRLGVVLLKEKQPEAARPHLETAARLSPGVPAVWLALAHARLENGRIAEARDAASRARRLAGADANLARAAGSFHRQLAVALRAKGDAAGAVEAFQDAIAAVPDEPALYAELADLLLDHRTPEPAIAVLTPATLRFPADAGLARLLGLAHYAAGHTAEAVDTFLHVMDLAPADEASYAAIETLLPVAEGKLPAIVDRLRRFAGASPSSPVGPFLLAQAIEIAEPDSPDVEARLRDAIRASPDFWPAFHALHKPLLARGDVKGAAEALERAVKLNPEYAPSRYALAQVYLSLGDRVRAAGERAAHHRILTREREEARARQEAMPRLPYRLRQP